MATGDPDKTNPDLNLDQTIGPEDSAAGKSDPDQTIGPAGTGDPDPTIGPDATIGPSGHGKSLASGNDQTVFGTSVGGEQRRPISERNINIEGYELLDELGRGGMGVVYKARDKALNRIVALKMILAGAHASDESIARFKIEAEAVAQLQHRGIVQVYDVGQADGQPYCALEFIDGGGLDELMAREKLSIGESVAIVEELAHAMSSAHQAGIVHRDLKPANILISKGGMTGTSINAGSLGEYRPKITDFGLARKVEQESQQTQTGAIMGTPGYMAPEQARGAKRIGPAADIYSLGAILYHLVTGRPPFAGETPIKTIMQVLNDPAVSPRSINATIDRDLDTIVLKCLEKETAARYASAEHLAQDLHRYQLGMPIEARPVSGIERVGKWIRRKPWAAAMIALTVLVVIVVIIGGAIFNRELSVAYNQIDEEHDVAIEALAEKSRALDAESRALKAETAALAESDAALSRAETSEAESRRRLIDNYVNNALQAMNDNQMLQSLPWLSESLAMETDPARKAIHQLRFNLAVQKAPKPERTWLTDAAIEGCRFSADGNLVVSVSSDRMVRIRDISANKVLHELESPSQIVGFDISSDFRQAIVVSVNLNAAAGDFTTLNFETRLWDIGNNLLGEPVRNQSTERLRLQQQICAEKGWFLNRREGQKSLDLIDLTNLEVVTSYELPSVDAKLRLQNKGRYLAWQDQQQLQVLEIADPRSPVLKITLPKNSKREVDFRFVGDDRLVLIENGIRLFDLTTGEPIAEFPRNQDGIPKVAIGPGESGLSVVWPDGRLEMYDSQSVPIDSRKMSSQIVRLFYSDSGKILFVATRFEVLKFDAETGIQLGSPIPATLKPLQFADVSLDNKSLAICSGSGIFHGSGCLRIWSVQDQSHKTALTGNHDQPKISMIVPRHDGALIAVKYVPNGQLEILDVRDRNIPKSILRPGVTKTESQPRPVQAMTWSPAGDRLAVCINDQVQVVRIPDGKEICNCELELPGELVFSSDGSKLAVRYSPGGKLAAIVDAQDGAILHDGLKHKRRIMSMGFADDDSVLSTISSDLNFRAFAVSTGQQIEKHNLRMAPTTADFDRLRKLIVVGGERLGDLPGRIAVLDAASGEPLIDPIDFDVTITKTRFSPSGDLIAVADSNGVVKIVQTSDGADLGVQIVHPDFVKEMQFSYDDRILLTVCLDKKLRLFDARSGLLISNPSGNETGAASEIHNARFLGPTYDICEQTRSALIWRIENRYYDADHASALSRFLSGSVISDRGTIVPAPSQSLKNDFSNVTIRQMMDSNLLRHLVPK